MSQCNYCLHKTMAADAKANGLTILIRPSRFKLGGFELYLVEKGKEPTKKDWVGWVMALPNKCEC